MPTARPAIIKTMGNPDRHIVLRGGGGKTNYQAEHVATAEAAVAGEGIARPIMIDCSHDNSHKDHTRQGFVAHEVLAAIWGRPPLDHGLDA